MNLYKISQDANSNYDTYDSAVVAAESEEQAKRMHPGGTEYHWGSDGWLDIKGWRERYSWTSPDNVQVELIGTATGFHKPAIVVASYIAG